MRKAALAVALAAALGALPAAAQAPRPAGDPPYPRIANLYGAGLSWKPYAEGLPYWKKLGMIIGGGSDWHYDYGSEGNIAIHERARAAASALRAENPRIRILPYYDIIEGPDNPSLPAESWLRDASGSRVSTWPGYYRVDTKKPSVLDMTKEAILGRTLADKAWDGVFLDCWQPDPYLVPALRSASPGAFIVTNAGGLPREVSPLVNGAMSEDELNLVAAGRLEFSDLMDRYLRWSRDSARPALSIVSCYPRTIDCDPWRWALKGEAERRRIIDEGRTADPAMMRFGLCFTLMGDGYFAYDAGTQVRGGDWWYPEFEAPLGDGRGPAREAVADLWSREFSGGAVFVNGSPYDEPATFDRPMRDMSTGRVSRSHIVPRIDGRIFLRTDEAENSIPAAEPRFLRSGSSTIAREIAADASARWQFPGGLELFFAGDGLLGRVAWKGEVLFKGGYPSIALKEWRTVASRRLTPTTVPDPAPGARKLAWQGRNAWSSTGGADGDFLADDWKIAVAIKPDGAVIEIEDSFRALADFDLSLWRQFFFMPTAEWKGAKAALRDTEAAAPRALTLPESLGAAELGYGRVLELERGGASFRLGSSIDFGLVDHRNWGTQDFLWAGYPASGLVRKGGKYRVAMTIEIKERK